MNLFKVTLLLLSSGLFAASPVIAAQPQAVNQPAKAILASYTSDNSLHAITKFIQQDEVKKALEAVYNVYPETKSFAVTNLMHYQTTYIVDETERIEFNHSSFTLEGSQSASRDGSFISPTISVTLDSDTGKLVALTQYMYKSKHPTVVPSDTELLAKGMEYAQKLYGDRVNGYQLKEVIRKTTEEEDRPNLNDSQLVLHNPEDPYDFWLYLSFEGDVVVHSSFKPS